jgi:hypothetical protein
MKKQTIEDMMELFSIEEQHDCTTAPAWARDQVAAKRIELQKRRKTMVTSRAKPASRRRLVGA